MNNLSDFCSVRRNYATMHIYYITYICSITLQAHSETIPQIWYNVVNKG